MKAWWSPFTSLQWRLAAVVLVVMAGGGWWMSWLATDQLHRFYQESMEETLVDTANILAATIAADSSSETGLNIGRVSQAMKMLEDTTFSARIYEVEKTRVTTQVLVTNENGVVVFDSDEPENVGRDFSKWNDIARTLQGRYGARATRSDPLDRTTAVLHIAAPIRRDGHLIGVVSVAKGVESLAPFMESARMSLLRVGVVAALAAALVALAATLWINHPLGRLVAWAEAVKAGGRPPVPHFPSGEVGRLGQAITGLQASLDGRAYVEHYVQNLTHELKSPIAGIRGASELLAENPPSDMREKFLTNISSECARLQDLVDRLLELASLERRERKVVAEEIALDEVVREVVDDFTPQAMHGQIKIKLNISTGLLIRGERFLIRQALGNLLANAISFAPIGSAVEITAHRSDEMVAVNIHDAGPGIPTWAQNRLFERFYSLPNPQNGRKGTGLGLAFVREIADLHGGNVTLRNHEKGGAIAELRLPSIYEGEGPA